MSKEPKEGIKSYFHFGFSSILLVFVMICIVTFGVLSLVTAGSDYKLSKKVADKVSNYYDADESACRKLAQIDHALYEFYQNSASEADYYKRAEAYFSKAGGAFSDESGSLLYTWQEPFSQTQVLEIVIRICYPTSDAAHFYELQAWKTVSVASAVRGTEGL